MEKRLTTRDKSCNSTRTFYVFSCILALNRNFKKDKRAIRSQAYLSREESSPLIILNKDHPSTKRLETVISIGDGVNLNCNIIPGTHPEQNILCSCDSLSGLKITKTPTGVKLNKNFDNYTIEKF